MARTSALRSGSPRKREKPATRVAAPGRFAEWVAAPSLAWPLLLILLLGGMAMMVFPLGIGEEDIWWHLKTGEWILANRAVPHRDLFTYTTPPGTPWIDTQWLFQAVAAIAHRAARWNGLIGYRVICALLLVAVTWRWLGELKYPPPARALAVLLVYFGCWFRSVVRPEYPTFALLAAQLWLYHRSFRTGMRPLFAVLVLQWLWGNWHSSCILGIVVAVVFSATELWNARRNGARAAPGETNLPTLPLLAFPAVMILLTLLNPNGWNAPLYALTESRRTYILEFRPPDPRFFLGASGLLLLVSAVGLRALPPRGRWFQWAVVVLFAVQSARMVRFFPYLAVATAPFQSEGWRTLIHWAGRQRIAVRSVVLAAAAVLVTAACLFSYRTEPHALLRTGLDDTTFPVAATDFVEREKITGHMFNEFETGGYLLWRLAPERKVFLFAESRLNGPLEDRITRTGAPEEWRRLFNEFGVDYAILDCAQRPLLNGGQSLAAMIFHTWSDWKLVFWDDVAMVFVKDTPEHKDLIARRACRVFPEPIPYRGNPLTDVFALQEMLGNRAADAAIEQELVRAIPESPRHFRAALALGNLRDNRQDAPEKSLEAYTAAEKVDADSPELQQCLAQWHLLHGSAEKAIAYQKKAIANGVDNPDALCVLASAQLRAGRKDEAWKTVEGVLAKEPNHPRALRLKQQIGR